jgi:hypothetical protein
MAPSGSGGRPRRTTGRTADPRARTRRARSTRRRSEPVPGRPACVVREPFSPRFLKKA